MEKDEKEMTTEERDDQSELREKLRIVKTVLEQVRDGDRWDPVTPPNSWEPLESSGV